jgi:hypothetical protein
MSKLIKNPRTQYIADCRAFNEAFIRTKGKVLIEHLRDECGHKVGVVVAFKDSDGKVKLGWSKCHVPMDKFDKDIGLYKAWDKLQPVGEVRWLPNFPELAQLVDKVADRAKRYWRLAPSLNKQLLLTEQYPSDINKLLEVCCLIFGVR